MKTALLLLLITGFISVQGQTAENKAMAPDHASLLLEETTHDFGKIPQGRPVTYIFTIKNSGKDTLKLEDVRASCGCTTPEWSREPVAPGASGNLTVGYNAAAEGPFSKSVAIYYNGQQQKNITITGIVYKAAATPAPLNSSISLLKQ